MRMDCSFGSEDGMSEHGRMDTQPPLHIRHTYAHGRVDLTRHHLVVLRSIASGASAHATNNRALFDDLVKAGMVKTTGSLTDQGRLWLEDAT
jgi:hypothetical protein